MMVRPLPKETPEVDRKYLEWIRSLPCIICGGKSEAHHQPERGKGTMGGKCSDKRAMPLCWKHHKGGGTERHPGSFHGPARLSGWSFWEEYGVDVEEFILRLNNAWEVVQAG